MASTEATADSRVQDSVKRTKFSSTIPTKTYQVAFFDISSEFHALDLTTLGGLFEGDGSKLGLDIDNDAAVFVHTTSENLSAVVQNLQGLGFFRSVLPWQMVKRVGGKNTSAGALYADAPAITFIVLATTFAIDDANTKSKVLLPASFSMESSPYVLERTAMESARHLFAFTVNSLHVTAVDSSTTTITRPYGYDTLAITKSTGHAAFAPCTRTASAGATFNHVGAWIMRQPLPKLREVLRDLRKAKSAKTSAEDSIQAIANLKAKCEMVSASMTKADIEQLATSWTTRIANRVNALQKIQENNGAAKDQAPSGKRKSDAGGKKQAPAKKRKTSANSNNAILRKYAVTQAASKWLREKCASYLLPEHLDDAQEFLITRQFFIHVVFKYCNENNLRHKNWIKLDSNDLLAKLFDPSAYDAEHGGFNTTKIMGMVSKHLLAPVQAAV